MDLDEEVCYRALQARDARFDGKFFTAVTSTGIYCRPICPARTPKRENVRFYRYAAGAEADGFRPCKRCRPETAPGTPAWNGTSTTVSRALRLIGNGYLDEHSMQQLATTLGMGDRHVRRLFIQHIGVAPGAIAQSRRAHFAARMLRDTDVPLSHVALGSGFGSIRQFNDVFRRVFGEAPRNVRRLRDIAPSRSRASEIARSFTLTLAYRPPFAWEQLLAFYRKRAVRGVELVTENAYRRSISVNGSIGVLDVRRAKGHALNVVVHGIAPKHLAAVVRNVRRMFDLDADPVTIAHHLNRDSRIAPLVRAAPGLRLPTTWDPFEAAVRAILGQQVSVAGAVTVAARIAERAGVCIDGDEGICRVFPGPDQLARADLSHVGIPTARVRTLAELSRATLDSRVRFDVYETADELRTSLTAIAGIGPWSAEYVALRGLGEPDAFPASDLGIRKALDLLDYPSDKHERAHAVEQLAPWRGYAALYLWNALSSGG